jgi:hypothetical protein
MSGIMDPESLIAAAFMGSTLAALAFLVSAVAKRDRKKRDDLERYARDLAAREHARLLQWRRGWAIVGEKGRVGFTADVHMAAKVPHGVVDVWRIEVAPHAAAANLGFKLDGDGRLTSDEPTQARHLLEEPEVQSALDALLETRPVRALELERGVLAVKLERISATVKELERCRVAVERLAFVIDEATRVRGAGGEHGVGPASGEPVPVAAFER